MGEEYRAVIVKKKKRETPTGFRRSPDKRVETQKVYVLKKSFTACHITWPPTSAIDLVNGMSFGQTSTQFCA